MSIDSHDVSRLSQDDHPDPAFISAHRLCSAHSLELILHAHNGELQQRRARYEHMFYNISHQYHDFNDVISSVHGADTRLLQQPLANDPHLINSQPLQHLSFYELHETDA
jgi:hypothetical protein